MMIKIIKGIWAVIRAILSVLLVILLAIVLTQRLTNNKNAVLGFRIFTVVTESMVPQFEVGDAIFTKQIQPSEIKVGDDVTYIGTEGSFKDKIVTHKVIKAEKNEEGKYIFVTKGIANEKEDPEINETQIYGKVLYKIRSISYINRVIGNLYGMYFAIFIPLGIIMFIEYAGYKKDLKDELEEENEEDEELEENKVDKHKERRMERRKRRREKRSNKEK